MNILIIGIGNVGTVLAKLIARIPEHNIIGIAGRNKDSGQELAGFLKTRFYVLYEDVLPKADLVIIATSDESIAQFPQFIFSNDSLIVHTAGAVSLNVLKKYSSRYGVLYPLQSLRKELDHIPEIPFLINCNTSEDLKLIKEFCTSLGSKVAAAADEERLAMHTAAVVVSNFTNHLYALAETFCRGRAIDFQLLLPLITETATRLQYASPARLQTGPAIRKDLVTINRHLTVLVDQPDLKEIYSLLTASILGK